MAKDTGLGQALYVGGFDLSGQTKQWDVSGGPSPIDTTDITQSANERIGGLLSGKVKYVTHFDPLAATHLRLSLLPTTDQWMMLAHRTAVGAPAWALQGLQIGYDPTRDNAGAVTFSVDAQSDAMGIDWSVLATAGKRTDTVATNGVSIDHGIVPPGSFGLQAYLQVFAFTGTTCTIKLQGSTDDGGVDPYADITGGAFTAVTAAPNSQKIATSRTQAVKRYARVVTTGTFTSITFAVGITINDCAVAA